MVPPRKLYRIAEIMAHTKLSRQTIHNYTLFGLIREETLLPCGYRLYGEEVFHHLERVQQLKAEGKSLREIREIFAQDTKAPESLAPVAQEEKEVP